MKFYVHRGFFKIMGAAMAIGMLVSALALGCGRTPSRMLGKDSRQTLKVPHMKEFISLSYEFRGGSSVKDVTFLADDGYVYTQEFMDVLPFKGVIRWVLANESSSVIQTRAISRWTGRPVNLQLPEDCVKVLGVEVAYASKAERTKMLTYLSREGKIFSKEYREGLIDRHFEGWVEVVRAE